MVEQGTENPTWLGHRGFLGGGGGGVVPRNEFHNLLPQLENFWTQNAQHHGLIPGLELDGAFGQAFAFNFVPDRLVRPEQNPEDVFPIAAFGTENFFQRVASYVHQCYILKRLRVNGAV